MLVAVASLVGCGKAKREDSACDFGSKPERTLDGLRKLEQCSRSRPLTLSDVRRYVGPPMSWNGTPENRTWVYDWGPAGDFFDSQHCNVFVVSTDRKVTKVSIESDCR